MNTFITRSVTTLSQSTLLPKRGLLMAAALIILTACSSTPKAPLAELQAAEQAIANAERAQVIRYTSVELNTARTELTAARNAVSAKNMAQAQRLARQSQLSAELAQAHAELLKAQAINRDMQQSIDALQLEAQRNSSGVRP